MKRKEQRKGMKRLTVGILLLMCVFLSGFFFHRGNQNREYDVSGMQPCIILNFLGFRYDSDNRAALERLLSLYSERHPDKFVSYEGIPPAEYGRVLSQRLKMKSADDVFMVPPILARRYAAEGRLAPLKGIPALKAYRPEVLEQMKLEGDIRYATTSLGAFGLFCNLDMLEKEGLSVPRNMAEFGAICGYFLRKEVTPVAFAGREPLKALVVAGLFEPSVSGDADSFFVSLETVPGRLEIALMESLDRLAALRERGWLRPGDVRGGDDGEPPLSFTRGETPFMLGGSWHAVRLARKPPSFRYAAYPLPASEDRAVVVLGLDTPLAVNAESGYLEQAVQLVGILTIPENIEIFTSGQGLLSPLRGGFPADKALRPLWEGVEEGRAVFHSDIRLRYPVWECLDAGVDMVLAGGQAREAAERVAREAAEMSI